MFKFVVLAVAIASAAAQYHEATHQVSYGGHQAGGHKESGHEEVDYYAEPHYAFAYEVHDEHTGDIKSHKEERKGDHTQGVYMLVEADGSKRIVEYVVEKKTGFNAKVQREESKHPQEYKTQSSGHGYSAGHAAPSYESHQPSYSSLSSSYKQSSYKPQVAYKSEPSYHAVYKSDSHYSQPAYKSESHYSQPAYKTESHYSQPAYKSESHYSQPAYKSESHYSQPAYKSESHYSQPAYKAESHYSKPAYGASGHATSSVSFSTHGAKISTSTKHVVPQKHQSYESKY